MDGCEEFNPSDANITSSEDGDLQWDDFNVPANEPEHVARPNKDVDLNKVLARAKAKKIGSSILSMKVWA